MIGTCGFAIARALPMLAIREKANTVIVIFAVMQNSLILCILVPLSMRSQLNIAVKSKARPVPKIQILPVYVFGTRRQSTTARIKSAAAQSLSIVFMVLLSVFLCR